LLWFLDPNCDISSMPPFSTGGILGVFSPNFHLLLNGEQYIFVFCNLIFVIFLKFKLNCK